VPVGFKANSEAGTQSQSNTIIGSSLTLDNPANAVKAMLGSGFIPVALYDQSTNNTLLNTFYSSGQPKSFTPNVNLQKTP